MKVQDRPVLRKCCDDECMATVAGTRFDDGTVAQASRIFAALGDEIRLKMVKLLSEHDSLCVCELQQAFDVGQPTVSHHLRILREAGLVDVTRRGTWAYYSLRRDTLRAPIRDVVSAV